MTNPYENTDNAQRFERLPKWAQAELWDLHRMNREQQDTIRKLQGDDQKMDEWYDHEFYSSDFVNGPDGMEKVTRVFNERSITCALDGMKVEISPATSHGRREIRIYFETCVPGESIAVVPGGTNCLYLRRFKELNDPK